MYCRVILDPNGLGGPGEYITCRCITGALKEIGESMHTIEERCFGGHNDLIENASSEITATIKSMYSEQFSYIVDFNDAPGTTYLDVLRVLDETITRLNGPAWRQTAPALRTRFLRGSENI